MVGLVEYQKAVPGLDLQKYQDQKVRHYRNRCREMGITPDDELIEQILDPEIDFVVGVEAGSAAYVLSHIGRGMNAGVADHCRDVGYVTYIQP